MTGELSISESNRSNIPPWPGIRPEESLIRDSTRSPIWPIDPIITPTIMESETDNASRRIYFNAYIEIRAKINPATEPSQLFLGLTLGNNLCFPNDFPRKNAAESQIQIVINTEIIKYPPVL